MKILKPVLSFLISVIIAGSSYSLALAGGTNGPDPDGLYVKKCSVCHALERSRSKMKSGNGWRATVMRMKKKGAPITDEEAEVIIKHLTDKYGK